MKTLPVTWLALVCVSVLFLGTAHAEVPQESHVSSPSVREHRGDEATQDTGSSSSALQESDANNAPPNDDVEYRDTQEPDSLGANATDDASSDAEVPDTPDTDASPRDTTSDVDAPQPRFSRPEWGFERAQEEHPWTLDDEQLRASGWEFREQSFRRGSPLAGFAALTAGIPFHGVGHLLVGDNDAMFRLLISEVVALGVTGIGTLMRNAVSHRNGVWATGAALQVAGLSVFAAGWITDVVGSFKGTTVPLPANSIDFKGMAADLHYTVLFSDEIDITSVGVVGFQWRSDRLFIRPEFSFGPGESYYRGSLFAEYRHPLKLGDNSYFSVWGELGEEFVASNDWGREIMLGGVGLSLDMGDVLEHTRGLVWKLRVGGGIQAFHYASQNHRLFLRRNIRVMLPVETSMAMNLNRGLNVEIGYRHRPDELVGSLSRFGGALYQQLTVLPINRLGISIRLEEGAYFRLWAGVRYFFVAPEL